MFLKLLHIIKAATLCLEYLCETNPELSLVCGRRGRARNVHEKEKKERTVTVLVLFFARILTDHLD